MARFQMELPNDLMKEFERLNKETSKMMGEMTEAGAEVVINNVKNNLKKSFKTDRSLLQGLRISRTYTTPSDDGINTKVMFVGYNNKGIAIPLIAQAREFGTSRGEAKKPFFRKSFNRKQIEAAMNKKQEKYLPKE